VNASAPCLRRRTPPPRIRDCTAPEARRPACPRIHCPLRTRHRPALSRTARRPWRNPWGRWPGPFLRRARARPARAVHSRSRTSLNCWMRSEHISTPGCTAQHGSALLLPPALLFGLYILIALGTILLLPTTVDEIGTLTKSIARLCASMKAAMDRLRG